MLELDAVVIIHQGGEFRAAVSCEWLEKAGFSTPLACASRRSK